MRRTTLGAPSLSLHKNTGQPAQQAAQVKETPKAAAQFTDNQFRDAWENFISQNASHQLLVNTMRASIPVRDSSGNFSMTVESDIQVGIMAENMTAVMDYLHKALGNEVFSLVVHANAGVSAPSTWNDRDVIADMVERHPALKNFITELALKLS